MGRLFAEAGLSGGTDEAGEPGAQRPALEVIGVSEGELDQAGEALLPDAVAPVMARIEHLRSNREARVELAARALAGSLAGLGPLVDQIADDAAHEAIDAAALHRVASTHYDRGLAAVREAMARGTFLREEALRHWQDYVGADDVTRIFSKGRFPGCPGICRMSGFATPDMRMSPRISGESGRCHPLTHQREVGYRAFRVQQPADQHHAQPQPRQRQAAAEILENPGFG